MGERIHEKGSAPADFVAQERDASAGVVVSLDNDIFEFFAEKLFDGGFVLLCDLGKISENTDGAEMFSAASLVCREEFLDRIRRVGTVVQDLCERGMPRADTGERIAKGLGLLAGRFALRTQIEHFCLELRRLLLQRMQLGGSRLEIMGRFFGFA